MPNNDKQILKDILPINVLQELPGDFLNENNFQPSTHNPLTNNRFRFVLSRCPTVTYFCQRANVPSLSFGTTVQSSPTGVPVRRPGTSYVYEDLQIGFSIDENLNNWLEIHNWIRDLGVSYVGAVEQIREFQKTATAYLFVLTSAYRPMVTVKFHNVYPTFVSGINFDSSLPDTEPVIATATFSYTHYEVQTFTTAP